MQPHTGPETWRDLGKRTVPRLGTRTRFGSAVETKQLGSRSADRSWIMGLVDPERVKSYSAVCPVALRKFWKIMD